MGEYFTMGEEFAPAPRVWRNDDDRVEGPGWSAERTADGFVLEWDAGQLMSAYVSSAISEADFMALRRDPALFAAVRVRHEPESKARLCEAIRAYLHWRRSLDPQEDEAAVRALAPEDRSADALVAAVHQAIADSEQHAFTIEELKQDGGGDRFKAALAARRPDLDDEAVHALGSRIFHNLFR